MDEATSTPGSPIRNGRARAARRLAIGVCMLIGAGGGYVLWGNYLFAGSFLLQPTQEPDSHTDKVFPGQRATIQWLQENGLHRIHSLPYDSNPYFYQRLMELIYPRLLVPTPAAALPAGALVVVKKDVELPRPGDPVFRAGDITVWKVRG